MKRVKTYLKTKTTSEKLFIVLFALIILIGIFLRTYNFQEWLHFGSDQVRDVIVTEGVINNNRSWPLLGADASNTHFKLGPVYYYYQIISAKIFGIKDPSVVAYPDVLFSILAIPLFYFLLRKYFDKNLTLALTLLYAISFYTIEFSRFAWNTNPIPFFVMLFLFSFIEFFVTREKTDLKWIILIGIAFGVGIQLHTLLIFLLPTTFFILSTFLLWKNPQVFRKICLIIGLAVVLNAGQIISETQTSGANTKQFMTAFTDRSGSGLDTFSHSLVADIFAHTQANIHILSSLGDKWVLTFLSTLSHPEKESSVGLYIIYVTGIFTSILFFIFGYGLLVTHFLQEQDVRKKNFLGIILLYAALSFLVIFSIAQGAPLRYFIHTTFIPFILLGLVFHWLQSRLSLRNYIILITLVFSFLIISNLYSIGSEASHLANHSRGDKEWVVLGEAERIIDYIIIQSSPEKEANLIGNTKYMSTYFNSLKYVAGKRDFKLNRASKEKDLTSDKLYFFIGKNLDPKEIFEASRFDLVESKNFGLIEISQLKRQ